MTFLQCVHGVYDEKMEAVYQKFSRKGSFVEDTESTLFLASDTIFRVLLATGKTKDADSADIKQLADTLNSNASNRPGIVFQLIFINIATANIRYEQSKNATITEPAHRMSSAIPLIKIAYDTDTH